MGNMGESSFFWYDYTLFAVMLTTSISIGIYHGFFGTKQSTLKEYFLGGKQMKAVPIALSLLAANSSGISFLSVPVDVYFYGATFWWKVLPTFVTGLISAYVFLPIFFKLDITSTYEYLEIRFDYKTRCLASFLFILAIVLYLPITIYIPALVLETVTQINVHLITPVICALCIFYTTIGGLKVVVWTDILQIGFSFVAMIAILILGVFANGGFETIWTKSIEKGRLDVFDFDFDPTKRDTFWSVVFGLGVLTFFGNVINAECVQKYRAIATLKESQHAVFYYTIGLILTDTLTVLIGLIMFVNYIDCDPVSSKQVERNDEIMPFYVSEVSQRIPGIFGLYVTGIFGASLSTLSAYLNSFSGIVYEDFISRCLPKTVSQKTTTFLLKSTVVTAGVLCTAMVYVIENLGNIWPIYNSLNSVTSAPLVGLFFLGAFCPNANAIGAFWGAIVGLLFTFSISLTAQLYTMQGLIHTPTKPLSTENCVFLVNETITSSNQPQTDESIFVLFRISVYYYRLVGAVVTILVALVISVMTKKYSKPFNRDCLSSVVKYVLRKSEKCFENSP